MADEILVEWFGKADDEFLKFERIPEADRRHSRPDLCAFLYLHEKLGGKDDVLRAADHDKVWLEFDGLGRLCEDDVIYLRRCGVRYDEEADALCMYV